MTKAEIAKAFTSKAGVSEAEAADLLERVLELLSSTLQQGESVIIAGFGTFKVLSKVPRKGRNPRTGEHMIISARRVVTFRPSLLWKAELNAATKTDMQE